MTPEAKAKAKELVDKFKDFAHAHFDEKTGFDFNGLRHNAKKCALIAVDEIIKTVDLYKDIPSSFWRHVKEEINKL